MIPKPTKKLKKKKYIKTNKQPDRAPSIMIEDKYQEEEGKQPHEIYFGHKNRLISFRLGLWVWLWPKDHERVHNNGNFDKELKKEGQRRFEKLYSREEFMKEIGFNYLWEEE